MKRVFLSMLFVSMLIPMMAQEEQTVQQEATTNYLIEGIHRRGFSSITELGTSFSYGKTFFTISETWGMRINPYLFVGQGLQLNVTSNKWADFAATANVRVNFTDKKVAPMFTTDFGVNKTNQSTYGNEVMTLKDRQFVMQNGLGIDFRFGPYAALTLNGGYKLLTDFKQSNHGGFVKIGYIF